MLPVTGLSQLESLKAASCTFQALRVAYSRVEKSAADPVESPHIHQQREAIRDRNDDDALRAWRGISWRWWRRDMVRCHDVARVCNEEEHEGANEFARAGDEVAFDAVLRGMAKRVSSSRFLGRAIVPAIRRPWSDAWNAGVVGLWKLVL
jgi:hypothetical protein